MNRWSLVHHQVSNGFPLGRAGNIAAGQYAGLLLFRVLEQIV
jgi:hypothetical protein